MSEISGLSPPFLYSVSKGGPTTNQCSQMGSMGFNGVQYKSMGDQCMSEMGILSSSTQLDHQCLRKDSGGSDQRVVNAVPVTSSGDFADNVASSSPSALSPLRLTHQRVYVGEGQNGQKYLEIDKNTSKKFLGSGQNGQSLFTSKRMRSGSDQCLQEGGTKVAATTRASVSEEAEGQCSNQCLREGTMRGNTQHNNQCMREGARSGHQPNAPDPVPPTTPPSLGPLRIRQQPKQNKGLPDRSTAADHQQQSDGQREQMVGEKREWDQHFWKNLEFSRFLEIFAFCHSTNWAIQSDSLYVSQSVGGTFGQSITQPGTGSDGQSGTQPGWGSSGQSDTQPGSEAVGLSAGRLLSQPVGQLISQPGNKTGGQPVTQPGNGTFGPSVPQPGNGTVGQSLTQPGGEPGNQPERQPEASVRHRVNLIEEALSLQAMSSGSSTRIGGAISACGQRGGARPTTEISACGQPRDGGSDACGQHAAVRLSPAISACVQPGADQTPTMQPAGESGASHQCMNRPAGPLATTVTDRNPHLLEAIASGKLTVEQAEKILVNRAAALERRRQAKDAKQRAAANQASLNPQTVEVKKSSATAPVTGPRDGGRDQLNKRKNSRRQPGRLNGEWLPVAVGSPDSWLWPNDASLSMKDVEHRRHGWWAIETLNPNAWPAAAEYLNGTSADIVLVQEAKVPEGYPADAAEQTARTLKWSVSINPCAITGNGGKSAGTAVATRTHIGMSLPSAVQATSHLHAKGRFSMKRISAITKGGLHSGSIYLKDGVGVRSKVNIELLDAVAHTLDNITGPWIIGGDWNCSPEDLAATGWVQRVGGVIKAPAGPTCNDNTYDFFVVSKSIADDVNSVHLIGDAGLSPHHPVRLIMRGIMRNVMVRQHNPPCLYPPPSPTAPSMRSRWSSTR